MDEQELERILQTATREVQTLGKVSDETAKQLAEAGSALSRFKQATKQGAKDFGVGMKSFAGSLAQGGRSFDTLIPVIDGLGAAISGILGAVPYFGDSLSKLGEAATGISKILVQNLGDTVAGFQEVGKSGSLGARGMTQLREQFVRANVDLGIFRRLVTSNSQALASFRGTAYQGAEDFATVVGQLTDDRNLGQTLRRLGYTAEEIGDFTGSFITQQTRLGLSQRMGQQQLATSSADYIKQLDLLAKLTGTNVNELRQQQLAIQMETAFRSKQQEVANKYGVDAAKAVGDFTLSLNKFDPTGQLSGALREIYATEGAVRGDGARGIVAMVGDEALQIMQAVEQGQLGIPEATARLRKALAQNEETFTFLGRFTAEGSNVINQGFIPGVLNLIKGMDTTAEELMRTQGKQTDATDKLTKAAVEAQTNVELMNVQIAKLTTEALPLFATGVAEFTKVVKLATMDISDVVTGEGPADRTANYLKDLAKSVLPKIKTQAELAVENNTELYHIMGDGGKLARGEFGIVGERGPEIVKGPANVISTKETERIFRSLNSVNSNSLIKETMTGPKSTYTSSTPTAESVSSTTVERSMETIRESTRTSMEHTDLLKAQVGKLDQMIEILTKGNRIGEKQVRASYS